jgi:hypothetical protein
MSANTMSVVKSRKEAQPASTVCLSLKIKGLALQARNVTFPLSGDLGVTMLPDRLLAAFAGGGVPQRMKANPKNYSTRQMIEQLHASPLCAYPTTRLSQVAFSTIVLSLTPEQNQAFEVVGNEPHLLASCAPMVVDATGLLRETEGSGIECFMLRRSADSSVKCVFVAEGLHKSPPVTTTSAVLDCLAVTGAQVKPGGLVCLFNNSCLPRGPCSLLFSVLATVPVWSAAQQQLLVKRDEFLLQQYASPLRIVTNDLVAASNVNITAALAAEESATTSAMRSADKTHAHFSPQLADSLPPGAVLANILARRPGLQPGGCSVIPPCTTATCLQSLTSALVQAVRMTLGLRAVDGSVTASQVEARLQEVRDQLCSASNTFSSGHLAESAPPHFSASKQGSTGPSTWSLAPSRDHMLPVISREATLHPTGFVQPDRHASIPTSSTTLQGALSLALAPGASQLSFLPSNAAHAGSVSLANWASAHLNSRSCNTISYKAAPMHPSTSSLQQRATITSAGGKRYRDSESNLSAVKAPRMLDANAWAPHQRYQASDPPTALAQREGSFAASWSSALETGAIREGSSGSMSHTFSKKHGGDMATDATLDSRAGYAAKPILVSARDYLRQPLAPFAQLPGRTDRDPE